MMGLAGAGAILLVTGMGSLFSGKKENQQADPTPALLFFKSEPNEFAFLNVLGKVHYKFADVGELLANYHCEPKARILLEQKVLDKLAEIMKG